MTQMRLQHKQEPGSVFTEGLNADGILNPNGEEHASDTIWILNLISDFYFIASKAKQRKQLTQSSS